MSLNQHLLQLIQPFGPGFFLPGFRFVFLAFKLLNPSLNPFFLSFSFADPLYLNFELFDFLLGSGRIGQVTVTLEPAIVFPQG